MSTLTCAQVRDVAPELALGVLGGAERGEALTHLATCSRCQVYVAELTEAADVLPLLTLEREPPPGFEERVLAKITGSRRRGRRRWYASMAAAVAAAMIVSIATVRIIDAQSDTSTSTPSTSPARARLTSAQMISEVDGTPAGMVYVVDGRNVDLSVNYAVAPGSYDIHVRQSGADPVPIGEVQVDPYVGASRWTGTSSVDITPGDTVALVSAAGEQVCHGTIEATR